MGRQKILYVAARLLRMWSGLNFLVNEILSSYRRSKTSRICLTVKWLISYLYKKQWKKRGIKMRTGLRNHIAYSSNKTSQRNWVELSSAISTALKWNLILSSEKRATWIAQAPCQHVHFYVAISHSNWSLYVTRTPIKFNKFHTRCAHVNL
jgi:hypothetical protein